MLPPALEALAFLHRGGTPVPRPAQARRRPHGGRRSTEARDDTDPARGRAAGEPRPAEPLRPAGSACTAGPPGRRVWGLRRHADVEAPRPESPMAGRGVQDHEPATVPAAGLRRCRAACLGREPPPPDRRSPAHCRISCARRRRRSVPTARPAAREAHRQPHSPRPGASGRHCPHGCGCLRLSSCCDQRHYALFHGHTSARPASDVAAVPGAARDPGHQFPQHAAARGGSCSTCGAGTARLGRAFQARLPRASLRASRPYPRSCRRTPYRRYVIPNPHHPRAVP